MPKSFRIDGHRNKRTVCSYLGSCKSETNLFSLSTNGEVNQCELGVDHRLLLKKARQSREPMRNYNGVSLPKQWRILVFAMKVTRPRSVDRKLPTSDFGSNISSRKVEVDRWIQSQSRKPVTGVFEMTTIDDPTKRSLFFAYDRLSGMMYLYSAYDR